MKVKIHEREIVFDDFFKIEKALVSHEKFDGGMSKVLSRLNLKRGDAVTAIIYHKNKDALLLTKQFRYSTVEKGPGWITEFAAGMKEEDEEPLECIKREIIEEVGYKCEEIDFLFKMYMSPGGSDQLMYFYYTEVDESQKVSEGGGLDSEHEDIKIIELALDEIKSYLDSGKLMDAKTHVGLYWFLNNKYGK